MPFKNFSIWRKKLPHWRADDVVYYVTFRHRRALEEAEMNLLFRKLLMAQGLKLDYLAILVVPETTEMLFTVRAKHKGVEIEFSKFVENVKRKTGKKIIENTGERYIPFWEESFDRIVRDEAELQERWDAIVEAPVRLELCEDPEDYENLFVAGKE